MLGSALAVFAAAASSTPSLVPRAWWAQIVVAALVGIIFYALGSFMAWVYRGFELPGPSATARRWGWVVVSVVSIAALMGAGFLGRSWQLDLRETMGMPAEVSVLWIIATILGLVVAVVLLMVGRGIRWVAQRLGALLRRALPRRVGTAVGVVITAAVAWSLATGIAVDWLYRGMDASFSAVDRETKEGVENPESPYRSAGPNSGITWKEMGSEGRTFVSRGLTADRISEVTGADEAVQPVRVFAGLRSADDAAGRAQVVIEDLKRLGGFDRSVVAVAGGTGTGWIDPQAAAALEYVTNGDVATASMQYSYLPSWLSFVVDRERAKANAEELLVALRIELDSMPESERPELYVYGESLGAYSTGNAFTSVEDMSTTTDGALLIGPPSFDATWQRVQEGREEGSPLWRPEYGNGSLVRVGGNPEELTDPSLEWGPSSRIVYLVNASDPIVSWTSDRSEWLDPRGPGVLDEVRELPVIGIVQGTVDQLGANATPPGFGHIYDETIATAWAEIIEPTDLDRDDIDAIADAVSKISREVEGTDPDT